MGLYLVKSPTRWDGQQLAVEKTAAEVGDSKQPGWPGRFKDKTSDEEQEESAQSYRAQPHSEEEWRLPSVAIKVLKRAIFPPRQNARESDDAGGEQDYQEERRSTPHR
ncbi:hypothetical protein PWT90_09960 [Aphanocladium album]|nr:hypothetical protein PWT90_09960 [Aphanocladium album]